jgi:hypothetical protein
MFNELPLSKETQELQTLQASPSEVLFSQLIVFAKILAHVVLPTPRGPQKRNA